MPKINFEKIVKADRNKVFGIATNFKEFQKILPEYFPSIRVRSIRDNVAVVEEHIRISGKELVLMTKHVIQYPELHEIFVIGGDMKGSHIVEKYDTIEQGTKITFDADIKLNGIQRMTDFFMKGKISRGFANIIDEFAKFAETQSP